MLRLAWTGLSGRGEGAADFLQARLGDRKLSEDAGHDVFRGDLFGIGFKAGDDAVSENVRGDAFHIVGGDETASVEVGVGSRGKRQGDGGARGCAVSEEGDDVGEAV